VSGSRTRVLRGVEPDGQIVGNIGSFDIEGKRHVGY
jgi:hypothetical protein